MSKQIYKYHVGFQITEIELPMRSRVVHFGVQGDSFVFWAEVTGDSYTDRHQFIVVPTGYKVQDSWEYHGTCQDGQFVWHLYEVRE